MISTAGDATLSVADPSTHRDRPPGQRHVLAQPGAAGQASSPAAGPAGAFAAVSGSPLTLASWTNPVSNDPVTIAFKQTILASEGLRTGTYAKTLTFTLSTTKP